MLQWKHGNTKIHTKIHLGHTTKKALKLLKQDQKYLDGFYLSGGTALALQLGHRKTDWEDVKTGITKAVSEYLAVAS